MRWLGNFLGGALGVVWLLGGPITYIISVIDTWDSNRSVIVKLLINLTLDALAAAVWPVIWIIWIIQYAIGYSTPLTRVLGL